MNLIHINAGAARRLLQILIWTVAALLPAAPLLAQDFERTFGKTLLENGVATVTTANGELATAGWSWDPATQAGTIYMVRTDVAGNVVWERRYQVGDPSSAAFCNDMKETANGDFILVGNVVPQTVGVCLGCTRVLVLRVSSAGELVWYRIFGNMTSHNQYPAGIIETTIPINGDTRYVGDIVISGATYYGSDQRGFLARIDADGTLLWANEYDPDPNIANTNMLWNLDEERLRGSGDIVATGYSGSQTQGDDVWALRVAGVDGSFTGGSPRNSAVYSTEKGDRGYSIQQLRHHGDPLINGTFVIAGESYGRPSTTNSEILMLRIGDNPCGGLLAHTYTGDAGALRDNARCVREIDDAAVGEVGHVVVTGASEQLRGRSVARDVCLVQFDPAAMTLSSPFHVYGGDDADFGLGVDIVPQSTSAPGFVVAAGTSSVPIMPAGHVADVYVIKTDAAMLSCTEMAPEISNVNAELSMNCPLTPVIDPGWQTFCGFGGAAMDWGVNPCP